MSELKFVCPSCGQLMQCEKAYVGHEISCPTCSVPLRIPFSDSPGGSPDAPPRAQLVLSALVEQAAPPSGATAPADPAKAAEVSEIPKEIVVSRKSEVKKPQTSPERSQERSPESDSAIRCICPVCQSELRVSADSTADGERQTADLIRKGTPANAEPSHANDSPTQREQTSTQSIIEREKQIAAARAAHPVELYPSIKPRLSYILTGGKRPAGDESKQESAPATGSNDPSAKSGDEPQSLTE